MRFLTVLVVALALVANAPASARGHNGTRPNAAGLANATVLIIRHAEDAASGPGLSSAGEARAQAYAHYFRPFMLGADALRIDTLIASRDSRNSQRARLTLEPLSRASGIPIQSSFSDRHVKALARSLRQGRPGRTILIAWHHGELPSLMSELGIEPLTLLHRNRWPEHVYGWVVVLRFDSNGAIVPGSSRLIREPPSLQ